MDATPDRFDIDLGVLERQTPVPPRVVAAAPAPHVGQTLTELLAIAAADRASLR